MNTKTQRRVIYILLAAELLALAIVYLLPSLAIQSQLLHSNLQFAYLVVFVLTVVTICKQLVLARDDSWRDRPWYIVVGLLAFLISGIISQHITP